jgi:glutathione synthase/RimK-type ligase-like ATP-grasp enzyme
VQQRTKVLVVGTTADYIDWIRLSCPGRALFLTDPTVRRQAPEPRPTPAEEIVCDLSDYGGARQALEQCLSSEALRLNGIASYDCESMELAAVLAHEFALPYPSVQTVNNCRNKYLSKLLWQKHGLRTPRSMLIRSIADVAAFFREIGGPCVLKPLNGSGSELIFWCDSERACETGFEKIISGLQERRTNRLYKSLSNDGPMILAEEYIKGNEFSCDFVIENGGVRVIRITRKVISSTGAFGTARGYLLSASLPDGIDEQDLLQILYQSAAALGLDRAMCMLDFIIHENQIVLLELAPRPGGDCLPFLLRRCWNLDLLKLFLDFSQHRPLRIEIPSDPPACLGLRLHARHSGILKKIDASQLSNHARVRETYLCRKPGHLIRMPPDDYESWLLGHIIMEPDGHIELEAQCQTLVDKLVVEIE